MPQPDTAAGFYRTHRGETAAAVLRQRIGAIWPRLERQSVLGLGFAGPYLSLWHDHAYACVGAVPRCHPGETGAAWVEEDRLPFPDLSFDRILIVHGLDLAADAPRLLREIWRVLRDDGRILLVAPNRMGFWAHAESTPFGMGRPYSARQIAQSLQEASFHPERCETGLFIPPAVWRAVLRWHPFWERAGRVLAPDLGGVFLIEAVKDAYAALPVTAPARRRVILPEAA